MLLLQNRPCEPSLTCCSIYALGRSDAMKQHRGANSLSIALADRMVCFLKRMPVQEISPGFSRPANVRELLTTLEPGHLARFITAGGHVEAFCCEPNAS